MTQGPTDNRQGPLQRPGPPRTTAVAVLEILESLYDAALNSIFRFLDEGSPYVGPGQMEIRKAMLAMVAVNQQHTGELYELIDRLGGIPAERGFDSDEPFAAYLSIKFLLPQLIKEKTQLIRVYEQAIGAIVKPAADVNELLHRHLAEHRRELSILETAMTVVARMPAK